MHDCSPVLAVAQTGGKDTEKGKLECFIVTLPRYHRLHIQCIQYFFVLIRFIVWMQSWRCHWWWPQSFTIWTSEILYTSHFSQRGRWTPAFLCDNTWWWMTHTHAFGFFLHQLNIHVSDFGWQYSLHSPMMAWQQSVRVADPFWLIINISVRHWFIGSILRIATERCCNP